MNSLMHAPDASAIIATDRSDLASWLRRDLTWPRGTHLERLRLSRLWPGRHGRISFELELGVCDRDRPLRCTLQGVRGPQPQHFKESSQIRVHGGALRGVCLHHARLGLWLCSPDRDPRLRRLRRLLDDRSLREALADTKIGARLSLTNGTAVEAAVIAYRVGKRCVIRLRSGADAGAPGVYLKCFRRAPAPDHLGLHRRIALHLSGASAGRVRVPGVVEVSTLLSMVAAEEIVGARSLGRSRGDVETAARVACVLHGAGPAPDRTHAPRDELATLQRWLPAMDLLAAGLRRKLHGLVSVLADRAARIAPTGTTTIHRDFYPEQMLCRDGRAWLLDLDTVCRGHAELDVATFAAHLILDLCAEGEDSTRTAEEGVDGFMEEYHALGGRLDRGRLGFYLPCALVRLGAIHLARGIPSAVIERMWNSAEGYMARFSG